MSHEQPKHAGEIEIRQVVVCQRLRDLPGTIPEDAAVTECDTCGYAVITRAERLPGTPRRCIQCSLSIIATMMAAFN